MPDESPLPPPAAVPHGAIIAWFAQAGPFPAGWAVCDGTNGTPDLRNRFILGGSALADVGRTGGRSNHSHGVIKHRDQRDGSGFEGEGDECMIGTTDVQDHTPPYFTLIFLMKL